MVGGWLRGLWEWASLRRAARKHERRTQEFGRGWQWAMDALEGGTKPEHVEALIENGEFFDGKKSAFDDGARYALQVWQTMEAAKTQQ